MQQNRDHSRLFFSPGNDISISTSMLVTHQELGRRQYIFAISRWRVVPPFAIDDVLFENTQEARDSHEITLLDTHNAYRVDQLKDISKHRIARQIKIM